MRFGSPSVIDTGNGRTADLTVRLIDYAGEWLLDLPLMGKSFLVWSAEALALPGAKGAGGVVAGVP